MKERVKTSIMVLLSLSAVFLLMRTWVYDSRLLEETRASSNRVLAFLMGVEYKPEAEIWAPVRQVYGLAAVTPDRCAVTQNGVRAGGQHDAGTREVYSAFSSLLGAAMDSMGAERKLGEAQWQEALSKDGVYFEYTNPLPAALLSAWLLAQTPGDFEISAIGLAFGGETAELLWEDGGGGHWSAATTVVFEEWPELPELVSCGFAFETEGAPRGNGQLFVDENRLREELYITEPPDIRQDLTAYTPFLEALGISPLGTPFYTRDNARVYVDSDGAKSCSISPGGTIRYTLSSEVNQQHGENPLAEAVLCAYNTVSLLSPVIGEAEYEVSRVTETGGGYRVELNLSVNNMPLLWEPAVVFISQNTVTEISLKLCRVSSGDEASMPLPLTQALLLLWENKGTRLELLYVTDEYGRARAEWTDR